MRRLNAAVAVQGAPFAAVAADYLDGEGLGPALQGEAEPSAQGAWLRPGAPALFCVPGSTYS